MTMITPSYLGETIEYSSLHACRSTLEDPMKLLFSGGGSDIMDQAKDLASELWVLLRRKSPETLTFCTQGIRAQRRGTIGA